MSRRFLEKACKRRHLFLHIDINKTIIQTDSAGGRSFEDVLNSNAAANVFGRVDDITGEWKPLYGPHDTPSGQDNPSDSIITYDAYIDKRFSEPSGMQDLPFEERKKVWKGVTEQRKAAVRVFTQPGSIGNQYAGLVEEQREKMIADQATKTLHSIIPSFFSLVNFLSDINWPFTLIFRTFGNDLPNILSEWKHFVLGNHVCKPSGPILKEMREKLMMNDLNGGESFTTCCMFRTGERLFFVTGPPSLKLATSALENVEQMNGDCLSRALASSFQCLPNFQGIQEVSFTSLFSSLRECYHPVKYDISTSAVGGLVDHYEHWASVAEHRKGGKVFPIYIPQTSGTTMNKTLPPEEEGYYQVFFDDNIFIGDNRSIVDLRDMSTGESICNPEIEQCFCVPVNAFKAIVDEEYFLDELARCLSLQEKLLSS